MGCTASLLDNFRLNRLRTIHERVTSLTLVLSSDINDPGEPGSTVIPSGTYTLPLVETGVNSSDRSWSDGTIGAPGILVHDSKFAVVSRLQYTTTWVIEDSLGNFISPGVPPSSSIDQYIAFSVNPSGNVRVICGVNVVDPVTRSGVIFFERGWGNCEMDTPLTVPQNYSTPSIVGPSTVSITLNSAPFTEFLVSTPDGTENLSFNSDTVVHPPNEYYSPYFASEFPDKP